MCEHIQTSIEAEKGRGRPSSRRTRRPHREEHWDGFFAEFAIAVEAVRAAVQFQTRIKALTIDEVEECRIALRVGINMSRT